MVIITAGPSCEGSWSFEPRVLGAGELHRAREALEDRLRSCDGSSGRTCTLACRLAPAWVAKPSKKSSTSSALQIADQARLHQVLVDQGGAAAEIDGDHGQRLVHRQHEVAGAVDALAVAERLREELAEHDADVFDGVVLIDVEIARGLRVSRSKPPCLVNSSSMWSRKRMPVEIS